MVMNSNDIVRMDTLGLYINIIDDEIYYCAINTAGYPEIDSGGGMEFEPMKNPRSQEVLDEINLMFGTSYNMDQFK
jgi:hypothetical protein